jgi:hypothetical protein
MLRFLYVIWPALLFVSFAYTGVIGPVVLASVIVLVGMKLEGEL